MTRATALATQRSRTGGRMAGAVAARRERRKVGRYELHPAVRVRLDSGETIEARCRDISLGGAFLETRASCPFGAVVQVHVSLPGGVELALSATVRWISADGVGVQFGMLSALETHALVTYFHGAKPEF